MEAAAVDAFSFFSLSMKMANPTRKLSSTLKVTNLIMLVLPKT
jgi:hypothetical protein